MKINNETLVGIAVGVGIAMLLRSGKTATSTTKGKIPPMIPPYFPASPASQAQVPARMGLRPWRQMIPLHA